MDIYLGIDGSGDSNNETYKKVFEKSFVQSYARSGVFGHWYYVRGPGMLGTETPGLARNGLIWLKEKITAAKRANKPYRLFLSGYSRGGAAVTEIAFNLKSDAIRVHAMMLFDAVDMSSLGNVAVVPSNVYQCFHARRHPKAASRELFGNCATRHEVPANYVEKFFMCTHGGVGGTPWKENGASGKIEELTTAEKTAIVAAAALTRSPQVIAEAKRRADIEDFTNITAAQDNSEAANVKAWMDGKLAIARLQPAV
jgi:hypothetical protein